MLLVYRVEHERVQCGPATAWTYGIRDIELDEMIDDMWEELPVIFSDAKETAFLTALHVCATLHLDTLRKWFPKELLHKCIELNFNLKVYKVSRKNRRNSIVYTHSGLQVAVHRDYLSLHETHHLSILL